MSEDELLKKELGEIWIVYEKSLEVLKQSMENCSTYAPTGFYDSNEMVQIEALCSRFARTSDLFLQKLLGLIEQLDLEQRGTPRDRINNAEKKGIIDSAEIFIRIRQFRNRIAHEYVMDNTGSFLQEALELSPYLLSTVTGIKNYCLKKKYLEG